MDPLGFALENYNAIGQWRAQDGKFPVDNVGSLPDGRKVQGPTGLEAVLKSDRDAFTRCLTEKLLTYALGRGLEPDDQPAVRAIARRVAEDDYRFSALVLEIINSPPFQMRSSDTKRPGENAKSRKSEIAKSGSKRRIGSGSAGKRIPSVSRFRSFAVSRSLRSLGPDRDCRVARWVPLPSPHPLIPSLPSLPGRRRHGGHPLPGGAWGPEPAEYPRDDRHRLCLSGRGWGWLAGRVPGG
jgi:hypothetical protein